MVAWFVRRQPHHSHKRAKLYLMAQMVAARHCLRIESPAVRALRRVYEAEAAIEDAVPPSSARPTVRSRQNGADTHLKDHPGLCAANENRATERMSAVEFWVTRLELPQVARSVELVHAPTGMKRT